MTVAILLAAGQSIRFGKSKQLAEFCGTPLLRHAAQQLLDSGLSPCIVVLGASHDKTVERQREALAGLPVLIAVNAAPAQGISSSIRVGLTAARRAASTLSGVLITVCDQPLCTSAHLRALVAAASTAQSEIVASGYSGIAGVPAWFAPSMFQELESLTGDRGAAQLIRRFPQHCVILPFPGGAIDIDTPEDLERLS